MLRSPTDGVAFVRSPVTFNRIARGVGRMKRRALLGSLGAIGLAGCLRLSARETATTRTDAGTRSATTATSSATERSTTVEEEWSGDPSYPYGVSDDGVNAFIYNACKRALTGISFRTAFTKVDAERASRKWDKEFAVGSGRAVGQWARTDGGLVDMFRGTTGSVWREDLGDAYTYGEDGGRYSFSKVVWQKELGPLLSGAAWGPPERANDDRPAVWVIEATELDASSRAPGHMTGELRAIDSASMRVDERGIIESFDASYTVYDEVANETRSFRFRHRLSDLGAVDVREPSWVETARRRRPTVEASLTDDRRFVRVEVTDGGPIVTDSRVTVFADGEDSRFITYTPSALGEGDVAYLYRSRDDERVQRGSVEVGGRPSDASPATLDGEYSLSAFRKDTNYFPRIQVSSPD